MNLVQTIAPTSEPLSLEDAKTFMHILYQVLSIWIVTGFIKP